MKIYELFTELSSENRLCILQTLDEKPMTFTSLIKEVEIITGVYNILNTHEKLGDGIKSYMWYMSDDFPRHHLRDIEKKLEEGVEIRVILPKDKCSASLLSEKAINFACWSFPDLMERLIIILPFSAMMTDSGNGV